MAKKPEPVTPAAMESHGEYNCHSQVQAAGLSPALPLFKQAARQAMLPAGSQPIVIADYGSSQGQNSMVPLASAINIVRGRTGLGRQILAVHTDLSQNDFTSLFETLDKDPRSYLREDTGTFAAAVGRSFYQQVLPSNSVTLGWSSWAVQWLSCAPATIPDHVQVAYSHD